MKQSVRRIAEALLTVGVLSLSVSLLSSLSFSCGQSPEGCVATAITASLPQASIYKNSEAVYETSAKTPSAQIRNELTLSDINTIVQTVSVYLLLIAVLGLIALECVELRYIRKLLRTRRKISL